MPVILNPSQKKVYLPSVYDPKLDKKQIKRFREKYMREYGE